MSYIYLKDDIYEILKKEPIIIMDTNVWLDLYSLSPDTIGSIIEAFSESELFWLPNQVHSEFKRHVKEKRDENINRYQKLKEEICKHLSDNQNKINSVFNTFNRFKLPEIQEQNEFIKSEIIKIQNEVSQKLKEIQSSHTDEMVSNGISKSFDCIEQYIDVLHDKSDAKWYSTIELLGIYEEGEKRYKYKISPGFTDMKKKDNDSSEIPERKYGDLIIWKEILNLVSSSSKDIVFINNERKTDWWVPDIINKNKIPTVLMEEFKSKTNANQQFVMITFDEFINHCGVELDVPIQAILEITNRISFITDLNKYFSKNLSTIINDCLNQYEVQERIIEQINEDMLGEYIAGGNVDEVAEVEITDIKSTKEKFSFDNDEFLMTVEFDAEISADSYASVYWNKDSGTGGNVEIKSICKCEIILTIDYTQLPEESYSLYEYSINQFKISTLNFNDYDFDESMIEDGEYECPDCGRKYDIDEDGGNGFCINCASDH